MARSSLARLAPGFLYAAGAIYLLFAAYFVILIINVYSDLGDVVNLLDFYINYLVYLMPVALLLSFIGWYYSGRALTSAMLFMTIGSASLLASFLIFWIILGASLTMLLFSWVYWLPSAITLLLGGYTIANPPSMHHLPLSVIEPLFENRRRALRTTSTYAWTYQSLQSTRLDTHDKNYVRRTLRRI